MTLQQRVFDIVLAAILLGLLAPVLLTLAVWLMLAQGRPVFFRTERMKSPTEGFLLLKFRTMAVDGDQTGVTGGNKAAQITPQGAWMRARRLDELPQLWNILRGDLSFVGPRPPLRHYVERFPSVYQKVLRSRPGVTGMASLAFSAQEAILLSQCRTSRETDAVYCKLCIPAKARLDLAYARRRTFWSDAGLLIYTARTPFAPLKTQRLLSRARIRR